MISRRVLFNTVKSLLFLEHLTFREFQFRWPAQSRI